MTIYSDNLKTEKLDYQDADLTLIATVKPLLEEDAIMTQIDSFEVSK